MKRAIVAVSLVVLAMASVAVHAADDTRTIAGWAFSDVGSKPGDDTDRHVMIEKKNDFADLSYAPGDQDTGGFVHIDFAALAGCRGSDSGTGFGLDGTLAKREQAVRGVVHEMFTDYAKDCKAVPATAEATIMAGFTDAFAAVEKTMHDHPYVYPPDPADNTTGNRT